MNHRSGFAVGHRNDAPPAYDPLIRRDARRLMRIAAGGMAWGETGEIVLPRHLPPIAHLVRESPLCDRPTAAVGVHANVFTMARVVDWNGKDIPEALRDLPPGRYVLESADEAPALSEEEEDGLRRALASVASGKGRSADEVRRTISDALRR